MALAKTKSALLMASFGSPRQRRIEFMTLLQCSYRAARYVARLKHRDFRALRFHFPSDWSSVLNCSKSRNAGRKFLRDDWHLRDAKAFWGMECRRFARFRLLALSSCSPLHSSHWSERRPKLSRASRIGPASVSAAISATAAAQRCWSDLPANIAWTNNGNGGTATFDADGITYGLHGGYNFQSGRVVVGVETDIAPFQRRRQLQLESPGDGRSSPSALVTTKLQWVGTTRLRAGVTFDNSWSTSPAAWPTPIRTRTGPRTSPALQWESLAGRRAWRSAPGSSGC